MKKLLLSAALLATCAVSASAQSPLPVGSLAPNWTYSDITGQSHSLYNYLDSGYTVIMDISATWCGPCWAVHNSHVFDSLTHHYGVNGTINPGKIKFFFFEGDAATTSADLNGTGSNTQGNWVTGTNYTILDQASIKNSYPIDGFPQFYVICPNRQVSFVTAGYSQAMLQESFWVPKMQACPVATQPMDAAVLGVIPNVITCSGTSTTIQTTLQNMGTQPLTSATVTAMAGTTIIGTQNWTGNLGTYETATISFPNYTPIASSTLSYQVTAANDGNVTNNTLNGNISALEIGQDAIRLDIKTDGYPEETVWTLYNNSTVIATDTFDTTQANMVVTQIIPNLPLNSCLTFVVFDRYGDGITNGYANAVDLSNGQQLFSIDGDSLGNGAIKRFKTGATTGVTSVGGKNDLSIVPNPTNSNAILQLSLEKAAQVSYQVVDVTGRMVFQSAPERLGAGTHSLQLNAASYAAGIYQVIVNIDGQRITQRLSVMK